MITADHLIQSARNSALKAEGSEPFLVPAECGECGERFHVRLERPGRYQLDCPSEQGCHARVQVEV